MTPEGHDPRALRDAFGAFPTGVTVVTARDPEGRPIGFTANSFTSVSLDPPLLLVCLARTSRNYAAMTGAGRFAINILSEGQAEVSNTFARPVEDRFAAIGWSAGEHGSPILPNVAAFFECETHQLVEAGDHVILIGRVTSFANSRLNGLGYARGSYFTPTLAARAVSAASEGNIRFSAVLEQQGAILLLGDDTLSLPACEVRDGNPTEALAGHLRALTGLPITIGFLYSVYEDKTNGRQHIVYRAIAGSGRPRTGRFVAASAIDPAAAHDKATADIIRRFALESPLGNFGVYFGDETEGRVHSYPAKETHT